GKAFGRGFREDRAHGLAFEVGNGWAAAGWRRRDVIAALFQDVALAGTVVGRGEIVYRGGQLGGGRLVEEVLGNVQHAQRLGGDGAKDRGGGGSPESRDAVRS